MPIQRRLILFSVAHAALMLLPALLPELSPWGGLRWGEVVDLAAPAVLLPWYFVLLHTSREGQVGRLEGVVFLLAAGLWAQGQGMHLAANALADGLRSGGADRGPIWDLAYLLDEHLSHFLWHGATLLLAALLALGPTTRNERAGWGVGSAGALHGFTWFAVTVEGQTAGWLGLPGAALLLLLLVARRGPFSRDPLPLFFRWTWLVSLLLYGVWALWQGGLPEFTAVGLLGS